MSIFDKFKKENVEAEKGRIRSNVDQWNFFPRIINEQYHSIAFDMEVENFDDVKRMQYPHIIELMIPYKKAKENGFPTSSEMERIYKIEDDFATGGYNIRLIGTIIGGGCHRFVFCSDVADDDVIKTLLNRNQNINFSHKLFLNNNFKHYNQEVAPNACELNWVNNRRNSEIMSETICQQLELCGETFSKARPIDFYINFTSDAHIQNISDKLSELGFCVVDQSELENEAKSLHFTAELIPDLDSILNVTNDIINLLILEKVEGHFDGWSCAVMTDEVLN